MHAIVKVAMLSVGTLLNLSINTKGWKSSFMSELQNTLLFCDVNFLQGTGAFCRTLIA